MRKLLAVILILSIIFSTASATHNTMLGMSGQILTLPNYAPAPGLFVTVKVYDQANCSVAPIYTETLTTATDAQGWWGWLIGDSTTIALDYNRDYWVCAYTGSILLNGPEKFRGGQGQITDEDVNLTNLDITNLTVDYINATYLIGDGSGITNLSVAQYWNRTGTTLITATPNDNVNLTGNLSMDGARIFWSSGDSFYHDGSMFRFTDMGYFTNSLLVNTMRIDTTEIGNANQPVRFYSSTGNVTLDSSNTFYINMEDQTIFKEGIFVFDNVTADNFFGYLNWSWIQNAPSFLTAESDPLWSANDSTVARTGSCPSGQYVVNTTTGGVQCSAVSSDSITVPSSYVYVDGLGNDTTGDGTLTKPFRTVQYAINNKTATDDAVWIIVSDTVGSSINVVVPTGKQVSISVFRGGDDISDDFSIANVYLYNDSIFIGDNVDITTTFDDSNVTTIAYVFLENGEVSSTQATMLDKTYFEFHGTVLTDEFFNRVRDYGAGGVVGGYYVRGKWQSDGLVATGADIALRSNKSYYFDYPTNSKALLYNTTIGMFTFNDDVNIAGNMTANYFIGDGSQLTNLPVTAQYWNRTGTMLEPSTYGDAVNVTGLLWLTGDAGLCIDEVCNSDLYRDNGDNITYLEAYGSDGALYLYSDESDITIDAYAGIMTLEADSYDISADGSTLITLDTGGIGVSPIIFSGDVDMSSYFIEGIRSLEGRPATSWGLQTELTPAVERDITFSTSNEGAVIASNVIRMRINSGSGIAPNIDIINATLNMNDNNITNVTSMNFNGLSLQLTSGDLKLDGGDFVIGTTNGYLYGGTVAGDELLMAGNTQEQLPSIAIEGNSDVSVVFNQSANHVFKVVDSELSPTTYFSVTKSLIKGYVPIEADVFNVGSTLNITEDGFGAGFNFSDSGTFNGNVTANYFIGDGSLLTNIAASTVDIDNNEWLYFDDADTIGIMYNNTSDYLVINRRVEVPNVLVANSIQADNGYFEYFVAGGQISPSYPFTIVNQTDIVKAYFDFSGNLDSEGAVTAFGLWSDEDIGLDYDNELYFDLSANHYAVANSTTDVWEVHGNTSFMDNVTVNDLTSNGVNLDVYYEPYFRLTSGATTNTVALETAAPRRVYNDFSANAAESGTGYIRTTLEPLFSSYNTSNSICLSHRTNDNTTTFAITLYKNGVVDATLNAYSFTNTNGNNAWLTSCFQPGTSASAGDELNIEVTWTSNSNGDNADMADVNLYTLKHEV